MELEILPVDEQRHVCEECGDNPTATHRWASYVDSVPDPTQGKEHHDFRYRRAYYCEFHARMRKEAIGNTSRMTLIPKWERINDDYDPNNFGNPKGN